MRKHKGIILAFFLGVLIATFAYEVNHEQLTLNDTDKATVYKIIRSEKGWEYSFRLKNHKRFTIRSYKPLGYRRGDKLKVYELFNTIYQYRTYRLIQSRLVDWRYLANNNSKSISWVN